MKIFRLYGHINFLDVESGFVMPVFKDDEFFYSQVERNDKVDNFIQLPDEYADSITKANFNSTNSKKGEPCIYAFYHRNNVYFGTPNVLVSILQQIQPDNDIISSFVHKYNFPLPESEVIIFSSRHHIRNRVETSVGEVSPSRAAILIELKAVQENRKVFYKALREKAIFQGPALNFFINVNYRLSRKAFLQIQGLLSRATKDKKSGRWRHHSTNRSVSIFKLVQPRSNSSAFIDKWLNDEKEAQEIYKKALNPNNHLSSEILLRRQYISLIRSYEKLKQLVYEHSDMKI